MVTPNLSVSLARIQMKNPVMVASGTFGYGQEYADFVDLNQLGAIVVKGITREPWEGNATPRIYETPSGMLNAIGLQNVGIDGFLRDKLPYLRGFDVPVIVNVCGKVTQEYVDVASILDGTDGIAGIEVNISCPNLDCGGMAFGTDPELAHDLIAAMRRVTRLPLLVKLSPNVTDIQAIAVAVEKAGADGISAINTLLGIAIDVRTRRPVLANITGGLSGPAIKPVALRMVYQVAQAVRIPIVGMGGIMSGRDAFEFLLAGASAVAVGTASFVDPNASLRVVKELEALLQEQQVKRVCEIVGGLILPEGKRLCDI